MKPRVEFLYNPKSNTTLVLVWKGMQIAFRENVEDEIGKEEREKITKKFKRKYKINK